MNNDLISREALKDFINEVCFSKKWVKYRVDNGSRGQIECILTYIDNAPAVEYPFYQEAYQTGYEEGKDASPKCEWIKIDEDSIKNLKDHYFYLVADKRYCTPMKAKYHEDYPQFELLSQRRTDNQTSCVCLLEDDCTITHYMELPDMPSEYRCSECSLNGRYGAQTCMCFKKGDRE